MVLPPCKHDTTLDVVVLLGELFLDSARNVSEQLLSSVVLNLSMPMYRTESLAATKLAELVHVHDLLEGVLVEFFRGVGWIRSVANELIFNRPVKASQGRATNGKLDRPLE